MPVARHFGIEEGLPHRQINCVLEDRQGFIWVATAGGVARFDGMRFKIFNKAENGLTTDMIHWILEDAAGNLWLISVFRSPIYNSISSIDILDPISGQITQFDQYCKGKPPLPLEDINLFGLRLPDENTHSHAAKPGTSFWHTKSGWLGKLAS
ncbi:MAG: hypothetical protein IPH31_25155 [Lewinellaceae bacterium]|nr:hypothetical protein [Lewinellaceae bacterium]